MTYQCDCQLEAKIVEHHDNYRRRYACCPKQVRCFVCVQVQLYILLHAVNFYDTCHDLVFCSSTHTTSILFVLSHQDEYACG